MLPTLYSVGTCLDDLDDENDASCRVVVIGKAGFLGQKRPARVLVR